MCLLYAAFTLGGLFFHFKEKIIFSWLVLASSWALYYFVRSEYLFLASFCYTIYYACFCSKLYVAKLNFKNDLSYGIYVFAWPIQQTIIYFYPQMDTAFFLILSSAFTLILAYCSWHYVGKPALTLKNKTLLSGLRFEKYRNWILLKAWPRS
jgi:hypothetical protein